MGTLVLLHAFPLDSTMYDAITPWLSSNVTDVICPDFPGFGGRAVPDATPSLDVYADDIAQIIRQVSEEPVVVGGTSMGGYTAMALLRRHPSLVRAVVLIDTRASADTPEAAAGRRAVADQLEAQGTSDALLATWKNLVGATTLEHRTPVADGVRRRVTHAPPAAAAWAQRAMAGRPDSYDTLRELPMPVQVIVGEEDTLTPPTDAHAMVEVLTDARLAMIPEAGHLSPLEAPEQVAVAVSSFLAELG